mgnify:CR=1 FL=1
MCIRDSNNSPVLYVPVENKECSDCAFDILSGRIYEHHQKTIVMDQNGKSVAGFLGGFDMMFGRYATPEHFLDGWGSRAWEYEKISKDNPNGKNPEFPLPDYIQLPWHDIHSKVEGIGALDIYENFKRRWNTQINDDIIENAPEPYDITELKNTMINDENKPGIWTTQIVRSITKLSDNTIELDNSINQTFTKMVRQANDYIYIESQFFSGTSNMWLSEEDYEHKNLSLIHISEPTRRYAIS